MIKDIKMVRSRSISGLEKLCLELAAQGYKPQGANGTDRHQFCQTMVLKEEVKIDAPKAEKKAPAKAAGKKKA